MAMRATGSILVLAGVLFAAVGADARVGEKADDIKKRFGRPQTQPNKETVVWIIEEAKGPLLYTVTLGDKGVSIAEGLKPMKAAGPMADEIAQQFIQEQLSTVPDSKTLRTVKVGEAYTFGGEKFVCTKDEVVAVDDENGLLVIWSRGNAKSVMAVTKSFLERKKP